MSSRRARAVAPESSRWSVFGQLESLADRAELAELPGLLGELERLRAQISVRMLRAAAIVPSAPRHSEPRPLLTVSEVARALAVSVPTIHRWARDPQHAVGQAVRSLGTGTLRFDPEAIDGIRRGEA